MTTIKGVSFTPLYSIWTRVRTGNVIRRVNHDKGMGHLEF